MTKCWNSPFTDRRSYIIKIPGLVLSKHINVNMGHYPLYLFSSRLLVTTDCPMVCTISSRLDSSSSLMTELRYNNTAVRRAVVCWVLWPVPGILAGGGTSRTSQLTPQPPLPAPAVVFQSSRRSLLLSAVQWGQHTAKVTALHLSVLGHSIKHSPSSVNYQLW